MTDAAQGSEVQNTDGNPFYAELLKDLPDEHRGIVEPILSKFDANTTRRFQDLHEEYRPFKETGWGTDELEQARELYRLAEEEPETLYKALKEAFDTSTQEQTPTGGAGETQELPGLPAEIQQYIAEQGQHKQALEILAQYVLQEQEAKTFATEDAEFDQYMGNLKTEFGEFDEDYVTAMIANGMDGAEAVQRYQNALQEKINAAQGVTSHLPPASLSAAGGGAVPSAETQKLADLSRRDVVGLIANVLNKANSPG